jgi:P-type Ca2+ transporter type 2C
METLAVTTPAPARFVATDVPPDRDLVRLPAADVYAVAGSSPGALSTGEVDARRERSGWNELPRPRRRRPWHRFALQFTDPFAVVLEVAAAIMFLAYLLEQPRSPGNLELAIAVLAVVLLNAVIGFVQEYSAERTAQALQAMVPHSCRVLRGGEQDEVPVRDLVPVDVVLLEAGDAVPADGRVVDATSWRSTRRR